MSNNNESKYKNQKQKTKVLGSYPYRWIKTFYSKGGGYGSEPHNSDGVSIVDETLVEVKGSELEQFIDQMLSEKEEEMIDAVDLEIEAWMGAHWDKGYGFTTEGLMEHLRKTVLKQPK